MGGARSLARHSGAAHKPDTHSRRSIHFRFRRVSVAEIKLFQPIGRAAPFVSAALACKAKQVEPESRGASWRRNNINN